MKYARWKVGAVAIALMLGLTACEGDTNIPQRDTQAEANYKAQKNAVPAPDLKDSLERRNVVEHEKRNNQPNRIQYIYLLTDMGGIYAYFPIKGKISAAGSQLNPTDNIVDACGASTCYMTVQGPSDDGSFGSDEGGIFFFTVDGVEIQWNGRWLVSDAPLKLTSPSVTLTLPEGSKPSK